MNYKIAFIITSVVLMICTILFLAFDRENKQYKVFKRDGYILASGNTVANSSVKYYFNSGSKYKNKYPANIVFSDIDGNQVSIKETDVVHYTDGSLSLLKKSVIINTDELDRDILKYYNIFEQTIMDNFDGVYSVNNAGKKITFTNFIIKVSDNKFLLVSKNLKLKSDDGERAISGYLELNIIDGGIVRLENQEVSLQTVSSNTLLFLGDKVKLDLGNSKVYYNGIEKFSLGQLVIDSDDNIPIEKDEVVPDEEEDKKDEEKKNAGSNGGNINIGGNGNDNLDDEKEVEDIIGSLPSFSVVSINVTSNKMEAAIKITDDNNMLIGSVNTKVVETSSGKLVYSREESSGSFVIDLMIENLDPDTSYTLIVNSDYMKDGVTYNRDFLVKNFRTELIGISISKNYYSKSSLSFIVMVESYSNVKSAEALLLNKKNEILKRIAVDASEAKSGFEVLFDELLANTYYKVVLTNFLYDDVVISNGYELELECKTLKNKPTFGDLSAIIDKKNGTFTLKANGVSDVDNGIESYKYAVYDARLVSEESNTPIMVIEKNRPVSIDLPVDETSIFRGVPYTFKLITEFYDNEKYIEYESDYSTVFKMDGVQFPTVRFEPLNITFERIEGTLIITDDGNTIPLDNNIITVVYTNSTGNSKSFTTNGNLSIPFSVNNLRSNETYTISIYTTVNLQDGNPPIDNCFVGSVIVKTEEPKELLARLYINNVNVTDAFSITANLTSAPSLDNALEASTLTGLVFNLYSGQSVSQQLVKSVKKVDRNLAPYLSDLKEIYYDNDFIITPSFFGLSNGDMQEEYYTIQIAQAYDYTDYKNNIPIANQVVTVKSNGFIPDLPPDVNDSLEVNPIRNKDAGDRYRADLNADTVVGYRVKGSYDNSRLYARYLKYYVHNAATDVVINPQGTIVYVGEDGVIDYTEFYLDYGSPYGTNDLDFRRGNSYYFTYEAYLDLNFDGISETKYPYPNGDNNIVLKSETVSPSKQEPIIKIYPSTSASNNMTVKYMISDVDNALVTDLFYNKINGSQKSTIAFQKGTPTYAQAILTGLSKGNLSVEVSQALSNEASAVVSRQLIYQYFDGTYTLPQLSFHAEVDVNRLIISVVDYFSNITNTNKIAALKVTFSTGTDTIVKDNLALENGGVIIDLSEIKSLIGQDISIGVQAYYDSGITGFDINDKVTLQSVLRDGLGGEYLTINTLNNLREDIAANGSIYNVTFSTDSLVLNNLSSGLTKTLAINCDSSGIVFNYEYLLLKKLNVATLIGDGTQTIRFTSIVPGVSLLNESGRLNISSTLRTAQVSLKFYGADSSQVQDNKFYVELYETNEAGTSSVLKNTISVNISGVNHVVNISNLNPKTQYFIKVFAYVNNGAGYEKTQLYDIDFKSNTKIYYFSTLSMVGIANVNVKYLAANYSNKYIRITYNLDEVVGYDKIKYTLYKYVKNLDGSISTVLVEQSVADDVIFSRSMIKNIPCPPGSPFTFDTNYSVVIKPIAYVTIDGVQTEVELDDESNYNFYLEQLKVPFVGIVGTATDDLGLEFKISISDIHKVIVDGTYTLRILDSNNVDITPNEYKNVEYSITTLNNTITMGNLARASNYKLIVTVYIDRLNNMIDVEKYEVTYTKSTLDDSGIDIGDVYTAMNSISKSKVDLFFYNSYKLTSIDEVRYSIYNFSGYAQDGIVSFIPTQVVTSDGSYYLFTLPETLPAGGLYYIELQFLYDGRLVNYTSIEHNYVEN